jgi:hypothetical protein
MKVPVALALEMSSLYLFLDTFCLSVWLRIAALLALRNFAIGYLGQVLLFYDFAPWRRLLI